MTDRADRCLVCGGPNNCGLIANRASSCWCVSEVFPPEVLAGLSDRERCLCLACLRERTAALAVGPNREEL